MPHQEKLLPAIHDNPQATDHINNLPPDCLGKVFQFLPYKDRFNIKSVCKYWKNISHLAWENTKVLSFDLDDRDDLSTKLPVKARTKKGIAKFLKENGHHLESLCLQGAWHSLSVLKSNCQNLLKLKISEGHFSDWKVCKPILPKLQSLNILGRLPKDRRIPEELFHALPRDTLREIKIQYFGNDSDDIYNYGDAMLPDAIATILESFSQLESIDMGSYRMNSDTMNVILQKSNLKFLSLYDCSFEDELPPFTSLIHLEHLILEDRVTDIVLSEISKTCRELRTLRFPPTNVTDRGISCLSVLKKLEILDIESVENTVVTDTPLSLLLNLKELICSWCKMVCDDGIITLIRHGSNLERINLDGTGITRRTLDEANEVMKQRTKGELIIEVDYELGEDWVVTEKSPLLKLEY